MAMRGVPTKEIAEKFFLSLSTVHYVIRTYADETRFKLPRGTRVYNPSQTITLAEAVNIAAAKGTMSVKSAVCHFGVTENIVRGIWSRRKWKAAWYILDAANENETGKHDNRNGGRGRPRFGMTKKKDDL